jgi:predicted Zn-ribbon and HTH transcriptional regulator
MSDIHTRKCRDCGTTNEHQDSIIPWVLCPRCGSQDARRVKTPAACPTLPNEAMSIASVTSLANDAMLLRPIDQKFVDDVEGELGMSSVAWDTIDPRKIIAAVLKIYATRKDSCNDQTL